MICSHRQNHISLKKYLLIFLSLTLYLSVSLSFTLSHLSGLELLPPTFGFAVIWVHVHLQFPLRSESPTIGFAETYFQFPAGRKVGDLHIHPIGSCQTEVW